MKTSLSLILFGTFMLTACNDDAITHVYHKEITKTPLTCMKLNVFPKDKQISDILKKQYTFSQTCAYSLDVSYKSDIKCNSSYNADRKALSHFPTSYLKMELRKGLSVQYSYYIDLDHKANRDDLIEGFHHLQSDLILKKETSH